MQRDVETVVLEISEGGGVVALVEAGVSADSVLRRAMREASSRSGDLVVVQLVDEPSAVRRGLAKAVLSRDVAWWSRETIGLSASIEAMRDGAIDDAVAHVRDAACIVASSATVGSAAGMAILGRRVNGTVSR